MKTIKDHILSKINGFGRGSVFTPVDFSGIAKPLTILQSLSRMAKEGVIHRLIQGVYEYPAHSRLLKAPAPPDPDAIARAIARARGWTIIPTGEAALNRLGLSTQVPAQWQYFTDGPNKRYVWEGRTLVFKHRTLKEVSGLSPKTALLVQAFKALGKTHSAEVDVLELRAKLNDRERDAAFREARHVTSWVYDMIKQVVQGKRPHA